MKRNTRTYKIPDPYYNRALLRGSGTLATLIESWVVAYSEGATIAVIPPKKVKSNKPKKSK